MLTIGIGGAAGEGVKKTGIDIGNFLNDLGFEVYLSVEYPSLIRGGHNFVRLTCDKEKVWNDHSKLDVLICLNDETGELHKNEIKEKSKVFIEPKFEEIVGYLKEVLGQGNKDKKTELIDGNTAFAKGLIAAGLDFYISYPMTPATSILHFLAVRQSSDGLKVFQPENEIAAVNMALGCAYAGKRAAVGTATGGFALMQEAFSFAGMAELPLVVAVAQRQGPATGVPTRSSQSDLRFVIHAGHGEFQHIVLAPGDPEEAFMLGADALNLAWKYRTPVIILLDKILCEHMMTVAINQNAKTKIQNKDIRIPGIPNVVVRANSYEHTEDGLTTDKSEEIKMAVDRRFEKAEKIRQEIRNFESVRIYGEGESAIVFFGSTKGAVLEAVKLLDKPTKLIQIISLEPFDAEKVQSALSGAKEIICVEGNHEAQFASLVKERTGISPMHKILRYDSFPFEPEELATEIKKIWS